MSDYVNKLILTNLVTCLPKLVADFILSSQKNTFMHREFITVNNGDQKFIIFW